MAKKILIADDDPHIVALISCRLKANKYEVVAAYDAVQTIAQVRKEKPGPYYFGHQDACWYRYRSVREFKKVR